MRSIMTIAFHHIAPSSALEERVHELGRRLENLNKRISECRVTLEGPHGDSGTEFRFLVKIELSAPRAQICADSMHSGSPGHEDIFLALDDAFSNATRQLQNLPHDIREPAHLQ